METLRRFRSCIYFFVGISLIYFPRIDSCIHSSLLSSEVGRCDPNSDSNYSNISAFCSFRRYVMESYYEKSESLLDSDFQDFIARELPFGLCEVLPDSLNLVIRPSVLERNLIGEGSHRRLSSSIRFNIQPDIVSELPTHSCEVIIIERLPSGVFADPFELQHLLQRGVFNDIAVFGDTNLELPSFLSNRSVVEIHMDAGLNFLLKNRNGLDINIQLPLHARYPPLDESGYSIVKFGAPDLLMRCRIEGKSQNQSCLFKLTSDDAEFKSDTAVWRIPSGIKAHAGIVSVITFISALLSALLIVLTSIFHSDVKPCKNLKQS